MTSLLYAAFKVMSYIF